MRNPETRIWISALGMGALLLMSASCGQPPAGVDRIDDLARAAMTAGSEALGQEVRPERTVTMQSGEESLVMAPTVAWDAVPARGLAEGVTVAVAHYSGRTLGIPDGFYSLVAFADASAPGLVDGRVQFVGENGEVATTVPAQVEIHTMEVPDDPAPTRITTFGVGPGTVGFFGFWMQCGNGQCIRVILV